MEIEEYIVATDSQLVRRVIEGDGAAFEYLFNRYGDSIRRLYVQRLGRTEDADDLLQETFLKVYLNLDRYSERYTFGQWVYTIARNTFIDYVRRRRDDVSIDTPPRGFVIAPVSTVPTPEERVIRIQQRAQIDRHLARMSERYRTLIEYRFFRDYSYEEIAQKLSLPLGTVKTQIHRAREQLCTLIRRDA